MILLTFFALTLPSTGSAKQEINPVLQTLLGFLGIEVCSHVTRWLQVTMSGSFVIHCLGAWSGRSMDASKLSAYFDPLICTHDYMFI